MRARSSGAWAHLDGSFAPPNRSANMPVIQFIGKIFPEAIKITVGNPVPLDWNLDDVGLKIKTLVTVRDSNVHARCTLNRYQPSDLDHVFNCAFELARASIDLVAFAYGDGLTLIFQKMIDDQGVET